ncbi:MAG: AAA family ATPase [Geminicoccaceae bacterium]
MRLRRIEIAHFRKLAGPVVLDGLNDGLIVVSGDNEEGKSTVLAALKAAFFEHHATGGAVREAMAPHRGGVPEIAVEFEADGQLHRLRKAFKRGGVALETPTHRLQDDAAERRLQELLRFERRQGRTPRPENAGLQALFWVDQATAFRDFEPVAGGRDRLAAAIASEVGAVAGGERSRRLLAVARERGDTYYTAQRQQETGPLRAASEQVRSLEDEHQALEARRSEFDARVDRLARLRNERRRLIEQDLAGRARDRCEAIRRQLAEMADVERRAELAVESLKSAGAERARIEAQQRGRRDLVDEAERLAAIQREAAGRLAAAEQELDVLRQGVGALRASEAAAGQAVAEAERMAGEARDRLDQARLAAEIERLGSALTRCRVAREGMHRAQAAMAGNPATTERLAAVRRLHQERETAAARVVAAATRIELHPGTPRHVRVDGRPVDVAEPLRLAARTELELEGFGRLVVMPGGEDLQARQEAGRAALSALSEALAVMGASSIAAAEAALEERRGAEAELGRCDADLKALLQAFAARSIESLAQSLADRQAELAAIARRLRTVAGSIDDSSVLDQHVAAGAASLTQAQDRLAAARQAAAEAERRLTVAATEAARLRGQQSAAETRASEILGRLAVERERIADEELAAALRAATERLRGTEERHEHLGRELRARDADGLRERLAIAERELGALDGERRRLDAEIRDLEVALREAGADSWVERLGEVAGALGAARIERRRLELEGRAWRLLVEKLAAADQSLREQLVAPISQRLEPLLQRVFPGAQAVFDPDRLSLTHLRRDGAEEGFDSLSVGAREQLAVLVRLAFASLLAEREGEAPCLILDDALVYADEARFETMKAILQRAARELQILVLTCRPRDYYGLDARYLRLEDCRTA